MAQQKPLMLKEYLELESRAESLRWAPLKRTGGGEITVRGLLETELRGGGRLLRSHSTGALTRLSAAIKRRSFTKKLRRSFWKRSGHEEEEDKEGKVLVKDIVRLRSFDHEEPALEEDSFFFCPSPVVSRLSSSSDAGSDATAGCNLFVHGAKPQSSPRSRLSCSSRSPSSSPQKGISVSVCDDARRPSTCNRETKEMCGKDMDDCPSEEDKEQLSPVSVMDFPYQDDDEDDDEDDDDEVHPSPITPSFQHFISNIERTKNQLLQQIRRFESLAELDPVDLDYHFAESAVHVPEDEKEARCEEEDDRGRRSTARSLLRRITGGESLQASGEKLMFDFFAEGLAVDRRRRLKSGPGADEEMLRAANGWVAGGGSVTAENGGAEAVWEMERSGLAWRRFEEEEVVVAAEIAGDLVAWVMVELVDELVSAA